MKKLLSSLIQFYQQFLSFDKGVGRFLSGGSVCIYSPTCSEYAKQAIQKYGILKGSYLGIKRILSCHKWSTGGFDPLV